MNKIKMTLFILSLVFVQNSAKAACEIDRPIKLAGMSWMSNLISVEVQKKILEDGFDCKTEIITGETLPMVVATARGDVDIYSEIWVNSMAEAMIKAVDEGKVIKSGKMYTGGTEGWWIPKYVADANPTLKSVSDLAKFKTLFTDPEEPGKGRFYNCPIGWKCEETNSNLLRAFDLNKDYSNFNPGSGAALNAVVTSAYNRKKAILFYHWTPTALLGKYEMVKLDMPEYNKAGYACNIKKDCENPVAMDFPVAEIEKGLNSNFVKLAPKITEVLTKITIPTDIISKLLAYAENEDLQADEIAEYFFKEYKTVWQSWLPAEMVSKIKVN